jgi:hypothetical protein
MMRKSTNHLFRQNAAHFNTHRCKHQISALVRRYYSINGHRKREGICAASTPLMAFVTETHTSLFGRYQQQQRLRDNAGIVRNNVAVNDDCDDKQKEEVSYLVGAPLDYALKQGVSSALVGVLHS